MAFPKKWNLEQAECGGSQVTEGKCEDTKTEANIHELTSHSSQGTALSQGPGGQCLSLMFPYIYKSPQHFSRSLSGSHLICSPPGSWRGNGGHNVGVWPWTLGLPHNAKAESSLEAPRQDHSLCSSLSKQSHLCFNKIIFQRNSLSLVSFIPLPSGPLLACKASGFLVSVDLLLVYNFFLSWS